MRELMLLKYLYPVNNCIYGLKADKDIIYILNLDQQLDSWHLELMCYRPIH
jgi:hypothetical protein